MCHIVNFMGLYTTRRSILAVLAGLNDDVLGEYVVADYAAAAGRKVGEGRGRRRRGTGDEITNDFSALPDLNVGAGPEPFLDLLGIAKLAEGDGLHGLNVAQNVSHCQRAVPGTDRFLHRRRAALQICISAPLDQSHSPKISTRTLRSDRQIKNDRGHLPISGDRVAHSRRLRLPQPILDQMKGLANFELGLDARSLNVGCALFERFEPPLVRKRYTYMI